MKGNQSKFCQLELLRDDFGADDLVNKVIHLKFGYAKTVGFNCRCRCYVIYPLNAMFLYKTLVCIQRTESHTTTSMTYEFT